jgi:molybdopterin-guanine dinucleotide biosynthesis protein A/ferredoxin
MRNNQKRREKGVLSPSLSSSQARVLFLPEGKEVVVPLGTTLLSAAREAGLALQSLCGGEGICGRCRLRVQEGQVETSPTLLLSPEEVKAGYVLACQARVMGEVVVEVPRETLVERPTPDLDAREFLAPEAHAPPFRLDPLVQKMYLSLPPPSLEDNIGDQERVFREIQKRWDAPVLQAGLKVLRALPETLRKAKFQVTATLARRGGTVELLQVEEGDRTKEAYGVAVDVGTSTVVAHLLHLPSGRTLDAEAKYNSQRVFGAEVTRRILAAEREGTEKLQALVVEDINDLISLMVERQGVKLSDVVALGKRRALPFELKVPVVEDVFPDRGPLAGIHAGLSAIRAPLALVLACDMPFFVAPLIHKLLELSQAEKIAVCVRNGLIEPFPGIYPKRLLPLLNRVLASENLGVQEFIRFAPHSFLPEDKVQELDPNGLSFVNLNSKEEVKERLCGR